MAMLRTGWLKKLAMSYVSSTTVNTTVFVLTLLSCALLIFTTYLDDDQGDYHSVDFHDKLTSPTWDTFTWVAIADVFLGAVFMVRRDALARVRLC